MGTMFVNRLLFIDDTYVFSASVIKHHLNICCDYAVEHENVFSYKTVAIAFPLKQGSANTF